MADEYEMHAVSRITIGTLGEPGNRTFFLQAIHGLESVAIIIEKLQALALAQAMDEMLNELENRFELPPVRGSRIPASDLDLSQPIEARFRAGQIGLGYDEEQDRLVLAVSAMGGGLNEEEEEEPGTDAPVARFWISRDQGSALATRAREVSGQGRPLCPLCDQPIDPEGHFCPRSNGHSKH